MSFRSRLPSARDGQSRGKAAARSTSRSSHDNHPAHSSTRASILRPLLAGMVFTAAMLYLCGWDSTRRDEKTPTAYDATLSAGRKGSSSSSSSGGGGGRTGRVKNSRRAVADATNHAIGGRQEAAWRAQKGTNRGASGKRSRAPPIPALPAESAETLIVPAEYTRRPTSGVISGSNGSPGFIAGGDSQQRQQQRWVEGVEEWKEAAARAAAAAAATPPYFSEGSVQAVLEAVDSYAAFARSVLEADELAVSQGRPLQGKYIVLDSGNELANRLRGVLSGFFLGALTDRVFVADITYQKDVTEGLLTALFEGPGYEWDLSKLSPQLRRALAPKAGSSRVRGANGGGTNLHFDMSKEHFQRWVCEDVVNQNSSPAPASVVTLSTVVYPLPLLARNPCYASHPLILAATGAPPHGASVRVGTGGEQGGAVVGIVDEEGRVLAQRELEALETLLTRIVLRPKRELRERARELAEVVRQRAEEWAARQGGMKEVLGRWGSPAAGQPPPVRVVGLHVRTHFVKAVSTDTLERNLEHFEQCAVAGRGGGGGGGDTQEGAAADTFFFVATDEANTQAAARKVWGDGCFFAPFGLPGSKLEGIKAAFVDLLVMASFDDYVMTPHSSFSELGATLSHTWLPDPRAALRTLPNRPIVPLFPRMNEFERRKAFSLLDRRGDEIVPPPPGGGQCMRSHVAGMSLAVAKGRELLSMFEAIEDAPCMKGKGESLAAL